MPQGLDAWGRPVPPAEELPIVTTDSGVDAMRAAILAMLRIRRQQIINGGNHVRLGLIEPRIQGNGLKEAGAAFMAGIWSLVSSGIIVPGEATVNAQPDQFGNETYRHFPYFTITSFGRWLLEHEEITPYDREQYLADARARLGEADEAIYVYLAEANKNFLDRSDLSASVMLGVSSELLMKWLIARFIAHVPDSKRAGVEEERRKLWPRTDALFDTFIRKIKEHASSEFSRDLTTQVDAHLDLIQTLLRINRDDVGHGRSQRIDREMVHGHLLNYLTLLKLARELANALNEPCTPSTAGDNT